MKQSDLLHFEHLKSIIEAKYLLNHTPTSNSISSWKGIDIVYFQEDLRKKTKATISEKSFYNYFKNNSDQKLPRIDMLNILSLYVGYTSWSDFKKNHPNTQKVGEENNIKTISSEKTLLKNTKKTEDKKDILQKIYTDNQSYKEKKKKEIKNKKSIIFWVATSVILLLLVNILAFKDELFSQQYTYTFIDADRNTKIKDILSVRILKKNESPIMFKVKPNAPFIYTTKSKTLKMVVSSPYYKTDTIYRNLRASNCDEHIELKPNDYAIMLYYYSKSIQNVKQKRKQLNQLINDNALIYQVYDNSTYGVETLDKNKYINLVTTPTTSLKNLEVIDTKMHKNKITLIKFRIKSNENTL